MKKSTIKKPITKLELVHKGDEEVAVYTADDGSEFNNEKDCIDYERKQETITVGSPQFKEMNLNDEQESAILRLCFGAYGSLDDIKILGWKATKDTKKTNEAIAYLMALGFNRIYEKEILELKEDTLYVIASWTEDSFSDRPLYCGKTIELEEVSTQINNLRNEVVNLKMQF